MLPIEPPLLQYVIKKGRLNNDRRKDKASVFNAPCMSLVGMMEKVLFRMVSPAANPTAEPFFIVFYR